LKNQQTVRYFGYTAEEQARLDRFIDANADVNIWTPLIDKGLGKEDCLAMLKKCRHRTASYVQTWVSQQ